MKRFLTLVPVLFSSILSFSQTNNLLHLHSADVITQYDTGSCAHATSKRNGIYLSYCKTGFEVKEWRSGAAVDVRGKIWVSKDNNHVWFTSIEGLTHYNKANDEWYHFGTTGGELPSKSVSKVVGDALGNVWCTYGTLGVTKIAGNTVRTYNTSNSNLKSNTTAAIGVNSAGRMYVSTQSGLYTYETVGDSFKLVSNRYGEIMTFRGDTVYLSYGGSGTLFTSWYSPSGGTATRNNSISGLKDGELSDMVIYPKRDTILISTTRLGIFCLDKSMFRFTTISGAPTLNSNVIKNMQLLPDDSIWVDYSSGYTKIHKSKFNSYKHRSTLSYYTPGADYFVNDKNEIWVLNQVLVLYKNTLIPFTSKVTEGGPYAPESSYRRKNGDIIATGFEKHYVFRNHSWEQFGQGKYTSPTIGYIKEMPNDEIWLIVNYVWAGYPQIFVYDKDYKLLRTYDETKTGVSTGKINDVEKADNENLYMSTDFGLIEYINSSKTFKLYNTSNSKLSATETYDLAVDKNNWVYVITGGTLNRFDGTDIMAIPAVSNFGAVDVDKDNNLWGYAIKGSSSDKFELNKFKQISRDGYEMKIIDTLTKDGTFKEFKVDFDNHPMVAFDDRIYIHKKGNFVLENFINKFPDILNMQIHSKGLTYGSQTGIYDLSRVYVDTIGDFDDGRFHMTGTVFYDMNQNNLQNGSSEPGLNRRKILLLPDSTVLYTNAEGNYKYAFENNRTGDTITVMHIDDDLWRSKNAPQSIVLGLKNERIFYRNIPCSYVGSDSGLKLSIGLTSMNCNDSALLMIHYENFARDKDKGNIDIWIDPRCSGAGFSNHQTTLAYDVDGLRKGQKNYTIKLPPSKYTDSTLKFRVLANSTTFKYKVYDSLQMVLNCQGLNQFKSNTPVGEGMNHIIAAPKNLKYSVVFNNTTKDTIQNILLLDTLDKYLNWHSFEFVNSSHSVTAFVNKGIAYFAFKDIGLPPGKKNDPKVALFVSYKLSTKDSLRDGTFIYNRCAVMVNEKTAYPTQKVFNSIKMNATISIEHPPIIFEDWVSIYPNPTSGKINLSFPNTSFSGTIKVTDSRGTLIGSYRHTGYSLMIDLSDKPSGVYIIHMHTADGVLKGTVKTVKY